MQLLPDAPPLLLTGFMGAGKTTVGRLAAARAGLPFIDLDDAITAEAGESVPSLFASRGEAGFRALEAATLRRLLATRGPRVIALGGGALVDAALRAEALERGCVVALSATPRTIAARTPGGTRPLLDGAPDREARIRELLAARAAVYAEAHARVVTDGVAPEEVAARVLRAYADRPLFVPLGDKSYAVRIASDAPASVADAVVALAPSSVFVVTDENVSRLWGAPLLDALAAQGKPAAAVTVLRPGEEHKRLSAVEAALTAMIEAGADRDAVVLAHGGGVVTDIGGFAASTLLRGVRWVGAPTTLLSMVDASVGGKTGVDLGPAKNAVGTFHQPSAVVASPAALATETDRAYRSGLAEVVKTACIGDPDLHVLLEREADRVLARDPGLLAEIIRRSIAVKAAIVARDERESGDRALLNLGHTLGHALEAEGGFVRLAHGEAVSLGMVAMLRVGCSLGVTDSASADRVICLLARLGLPTRIEDEPVSAALRFLSLDKKRRGSTVRAVLMRDIGSTFVEPMQLDRLASLLERAASGAA
ncbi:3-dehydroquinate synthase [Sorangium cellulosum]|uniref:Multifunctional fusion protein n=1 Tax=Sorangium cellulosum TaxID=56 RepID=A0A150QPY1_SORCE|nr:3-dehydroquinate synthase [Sorangium cellulosum]KYF70051.1 3-dehydroquinate synthase [Sorangium cellulosum]